MQRRSSRANPRKGLQFSRMRKAPSRPPLQEGPARWGLQFPASARSLRTQMGGGTVRGNARSSRMFKANKWIHVCLRSEKAVGRLGFLLPRNSLLIRRLLTQVARNFDVQLSDLHNLGGMLHFRVKSREKIGFQNFLRVVTTLLARHLTGARKGKPFGRFWDGLCYSRVLMTAADQAAWLATLRRTRASLVRGQWAVGQLLMQFSQWLIMTRQDGPPEDPEN